jgi:hypothetical protein
MGNSLEDAVNQIYYDKVFKEREIDNATNAVSNRSPVQEKKPKAKDGPDWNSHALGNTSMKCHLTHRHSKTCHKTNDTDLAKIQS